MRKPFSKKNLNESAIILLVVMSCLGAVSCGPDKEAVVQEKVAERVAAFQVKKIAECRQMLLREAEQMVDSLLLEEAKMELSDSLARSRPGRPPRPTPLQPIDSLAVKPLFGQ